MTANKHLSALQAHWKRHKAFPPMAKLTDVLRLTSTGGVFKVLGESSRKSWRPFGLSQAATMAA